jgi:RNA polymerase sigma-70 factor (ECF subfamily)
LTEAELIDRVVAGDPRAERELYEAHVDRIYRLAFRLAGEDELARDITQETFIRAFNHLATFRRDATVSTWLHAIGMSVALNRLRSRKRIEARETSIEGIDAPTPGAPVEPDLKERMAQAIDALSPGYRAVFLMHDVEGYTHQEIGAALGIEVGTSKAQLFRARRQLRTALADFAGEGCA